MTDDVLDMQQALAEQAHATDEVTTSDDVETERPEWLPENFRRPEELVASYKELQRTLTERGNEAAELKNYVAELQAQFENFQADAFDAEPALVDHPMMQRRTVGDMLSLAGAADQYAVQQLVANGLVDPQQVVME